MTKLTPELQEAFIKMRKLGISIKRCCQALGIDESLYYTWMKLGARDKDRPDSKYFKFSELINRSQAQALSELMESLDKSAKRGNLNAIIIRGQHMFPDEFPRDKPHDINLSVKPDIKVLQEYLEGNIKKESEEKKEEAGKE